MQDEEWRVVVGHPDYRVSSFGRVVSCLRQQPRQLSGSSGEYGHLRVVLCSGGRRTYHLVHCLVADAFLGPRPDGEQVRHLDGISTNNHVDNLAYGTATQNVLDSIAHGTHFNARKTHCLRGHAYDDVNTYTPPSRPNVRVCRACTRARQARHVRQAA